MSKSHITTISMRTPCHVKRKGFTLMEILVSMFLFSAMSVGMASLIIQSQRVAQLNVMRNTAFAVAQGYMEQILSMDPSQIDAATNPSSSSSRPPLPTQSVSAFELMQVGTIQKSDPLYVSPMASIPAGNTTIVRRTDISGNDIWNIKSVLIDIRNANTATPTLITMTMWIDVNILRDYTTTPTPPWLLIKIDFQYQSSASLHAKPIMGSIRMARTDISGG